MKAPILLPRDEFRNSVFKRDKYQCILCGKPAIFDSNNEVQNLDAHHIIERRLFGNGGYYIDNGATVCEPCHIKCEQTLISCDELREKCGVKQPILPEQYYSDSPIDKWGNTMLPNGNRLRGELFYDESVQKILEPVIHLFLKYVKYSRTFHVPWSPGGKEKEERIISSMDHFKGIDVIVTEKKDGENSSWYNDYIHARSLDFMEPHPSRSRTKAKWASIKHDIPEGWRLCVENVYAQHSIHYTNLEAYELMFSVWNEKNVCLSWKETEEWSELLEIPTVPVLYEGKYDEDLIKSLWSPIKDGNEMEGYVIRLADSFPYRDFRKWNLKFVREGHVAQSHGHWKRRMVIPNELRKNRSE